MRILAASFLALSLSACSIVAPDSGQEAVLVQKPWFFGHGGVVDKPVTTGSTITALSTDAIFVDVKPVQYKVSFEDLMSSDGIPLHFDASIRLQVTNSVEMIRRFGPDWYKSNVEVEFSNRVRQAVRNHGMNEVAISTTAIDSIDTEVTDAMNAYIKKAGLPINLIKITVGKANPPDAIKSQRIKTAEEQQRQVTEVNTQKAEEKRKAAEESRAAADNAYRTAMNLSPEQFVELERIKMQRETCQKGNCTFIVGDGKPVISTR